LLERREKEGRKKKGVRIKPISAYSFRVMIERKRGGKGNALDCFGFHIEGKGEREGAGFLRDVKARREKETDVRRVSNV